MDEESSSGSTDPGSTDPGSTDPGSTESSRRRAAPSGSQTPGHESPERSPSAAEETRSGGRASWQASLREAGPYIGMGFQLGGTVALFLGAGYLVDRWLGSLPYGTLVGGVLGMGAALLFIARVNRELGDGSDSSTPLKDE